MFANLQACFCKVAVSALMMVKPKSHPAWKVLKILCSYRVMSARLNSLRKSTKARPPCYYENLILSLTHLKLHTSKEKLLQL